MNTSNSIDSTSSGETYEHVSPREEIVLLILYDKELYGLQIPKAIESASNGRQKMGIGSLYPILHSLEAKELIESRWGDEERSERGGARRRYYQLTERGIATIEAVQAFRSGLLAWQPG
jgi:PadR family transcriptional regulator, regulatory protein PadR